MEAASLAHPFKCAAIASVLLEFLHLLMQQTQLESKYGLHPGGGSAAAPKTASVATLASSLETSKIATQGWVFDRQKIVKQSKQSFPTLNRITWAIHNQKMFLELVLDMRRLNDGLEKITLTPRLQEALDLMLIQNPALTLSLLQFIERTPDFQMQYRIPAVFKVSNLQAQMQGNAAVQGGNVLEVDGKFLSPMDPAFQPDKAKYTLQRLRMRLADAPVNILVERKERSSVPADPQSRLIHQSRLQSLAVLLHKKPKPKGFRVLDLIGYVENTDPSEPAVQLIFGIPTDVAPAPDNVTFATLDTLFTNARSKDISDFVLGQRFQLARHFAKAVHELHATNWLHRTLTSGHVICFSPTSEPSIEYPYICGFTYARPDDPNELSELDMSQQANFYRHPGIILLEIGLWRPISACYKSGWDMEKFFKYLIKGCAPRLEHFMGADYRDATLAHLTGDFGVGNDEDYELSMAFQGRLYSPCIHLGLDGSCPARNYPSPEGEVIERFPPTPSSYIYLTSIHDTISSKRCKGPKMASSQVYPMNASKVKIKIIFTCILSSLIQSLTLKGSMGDIHGASRMRFQVKPLLGMVNSVHDARRKVWTMVYCGSMLDVIHQMT
ncbi:hypothetical protein GQ44DRAFT_734274 [Phaeosphaeriaceae sp. PMI808]|nr:hypothetical protein GQ44DRAFT_734274 [Phaeosphaeriaceae sp. PMI808]